MLHVRAVHVVVERQLRKRMRLELDRIVGKADHVQRVARVLAADERVKRDGNLLGGEKAAAKKHRPAHVDHQDRRSLCLVRGAMGTGTFGPSRTIVLKRVSFISSRNGSPYSYAFNSSEASVPMPPRHSWCWPMRVFLSWSKMSRSADWPIRRIPRGVSSNLRPLRST